MHHSSPHEEAHDILAAEEFGIGTRDERWPADPNGKSPPHDVLAAEAFAMPVADAGPADPFARPTRRVPLVALAVLALLGVLALLRR